MLHIKESQKRHVQAKKKKKKRNERGDDSFSLVNANVALLQLQIFASTVAPLQRCQCTSLHGQSLLQDPFCLQDCLRLQDFLCSLHLQDLHETNFIFHIFVFKVLHRQSSSSRNSSSSRLSSSSRSCMGKLHIEDCLRDRCIGSHLAWGNKINTYKVFVVPRSHHMMCSKWRRNNTHTHTHKKTCKKRNSQVRKFCTRMYLQRFG